MVVEDFWQPVQVAFSLWLKLLEKTIQKRLPRAVSLRERGGKGKSGEKDFERERKENRECSSLKYRNGCVHRHRVENCVPVDEWTKMNSGHSSFVTPFLHHGNHSASDVNSKNLARRGAAEDLKKATQ